MPLGFGGLPGLRPLSGPLGWLEQPLGFEPIIERSAEAGLARRQERLAERWRAEIERQVTRLKAEIETNTRSLDTQTGLLERVQTNLQRLLDEFVAGGVDAADQVPPGALRLVHYDENIMDPYTDWLTCPEQGPRAVRAGDYPLLFAAIKYQYGRVVAGGGAGPIPPELEEFVLPAKWQLTQDSRLLGNRRLHFEIRTGNRVSGATGQ